MPAANTDMWESFMDQVVSMAAKLTTQDRKALNKSDFAIPEKAPGSGSYPIPDLNHARDALSRSSGKSEEGRVRAAVYKKFPQLKKG